MSEDGKNLVWMHNGVEMFRVTVDGVFQLGPGLSEQEAAQRFADWVSQYLTEIRTRAFEEGIAAAGKALTETIRAQSIGPNAN